MLSSTHFPGHHSDEKVIFVLRRHPIIALKNFLFYLFLAAIPIGIYFLLAQLFPAFLDNIINGLISFPIVVLAASGYYLLVITFYFNNWIDYYLDVWIVTDKRVVSIEQRNLFSRIVSEQPLYRIQDVTSEVQGVFPTIFKYGNVYIQTAGTQERFVFRQVHKPYEVAEKINSLIKNLPHQP